MILLQVTSSGDAQWLLAAAGPLGAVLTYWSIYSYYRNQGKSHAFETETLIDAAPAQGGEAKVGHIAKTREARVEGDNVANHRARVQRLP